MITFAGSKHIINFKFQFSNFKLKRCAQRRYRLVAVAQFGVVAVVVRAAAGVAATRVTASVTAGVAARSYGASVRSTVAGVTASSVLRALILRAILAVLNLAAVARGHTLQHVTKPKTFEESFAMVDEL